MVHVTVDKAKFTPEFMAEFRRNMFPFATIEEHIAHLGQLHARGIADDRSFIEGYGPAKEMGISFFIAHGDIETEVLS
jgi:hypothetical protein